MSLSSHATVMILSILSVVCQENMKGNSKQGYSGTIIAVTIQDSYICVHNPHKVSFGSLLDCIVQHLLWPLGLDTVYRAEYSKLCDKMTFTMSHLKPAYVFPRHILLLIYKNCPKQLKFTCISGFSNLSGKIKKKMCFNRFGLFPNYNSQINTSAVLHHAV